MAKKSQKRKINMLYIPIILILGYLPVLMRTLEYNTYFEGYEWAALSDITGIDIFYKIKAIFLIVVASFMPVAMLMMFFTSKEVFNKLKSLPFYCIAAAAVFALISAAFADNKMLVIFGSFENFESIFVTLGYFIVFVYSFVVFSQSEDIYRDFRFVYRASLPGFLIVAVIGFFQTLGLNLFKTGFGQFLIASSEFRGGGGSLEMSGAESTTLANVDYVSTFFAMWAVVFLVMIFMTNDIKEKLARAALALLSIYDMYMAGTDGGRLGFIAAILLLIILTAVGNKKRLFITIGAIVAVIAVVLIVPQTRSYIISGIGWVNTDQSKYRVHHITPEDDGVHFDLDGREYSVAYFYNDNLAQVVLHDENGNTIEGTYTARTSSDAAYYTYDLDDSEALTIYESAYTLEDDSATVDGILIKQGNAEFMVSNEVDKSGSYYFLNPYGHFVRDDGNDIANADLFPNRLFSGRGEIWNKTLPLLRHHLLIGCGSGLFITDYPQNNYIDKMFGKDTTYDVKPHNLYLQYWVEEGLPFLLLLLVFFVLYYVKTIKAIVGGKVVGDEGKQSRIALACCLAVTVFLVAGIAGDSMIVHSPVFWTFLGIGLAAA